jgi:hypothetical protein
MAGRQRTSRAARASALRVTVDACRQRLQVGRPLVLIDARTNDQWATSPSKGRGATRIDPDALPFVAPPCPKRNYIVVYCG